MISGLYTAASGLIAQTEQQDVIANNLANVNTTGYKKDRALFIAFPEVFLNRINDEKVKIPGAGIRDLQTPIGMVGQGVQLRIDGVQPSITEEGSLVENDNKLSMAIKGNAMFVINTPNGIRYTRDGNFNLNSDGKLVTQSGYAVMGHAGEIMIDGADVRVDKTGDIYVNKNELDTLRLATFTKDDNLRKEGANLFYKPDGTELPENDLAENEQVMQGYLESSNVNPVREMVDMIAAYRAYESSQKAIQSQDETLDKAVNQVGTVSL
jgi:flagellar basal-body rod protein FlgG